MTPFRHYEKDARCGRGPRGSADAIDGKGAKAAKLEPVAKSKIPCSR
jgi:hypothetical protein